MAAVACTVLVLVAPPARGQGGSCPATAGRSVSVEIDSPRPGAQVSEMVIVRGRAIASLTVSRVELRVGDSTVAVQTFPDRPRADFLLSWDVFRALPGETSMDIVACGRASGNEAAVGSASVVVDIARSGGSRLESGGHRSKVPWVGAVLGLSGLAGLAFSGALHGRRRPSRARV